MKILFKKMMLAGLVALLTITALPATNVFAQGENPPKAGATTEQLEKAWARQLKMFERLGKAFEDTNSSLKAQELIDKAIENGKDVSAVQAAMNAFSAALETSRPIYESIQSLVNTHAGFDANGKVTDVEQAQATVQSVRAKLQELKTSLDGKGKALRDALKAFRDANKPTDQNLQKD